MNNENNKPLKKRALAPEYQHFLEEAYPHERGISNAPSRHVPLSEMNVQYRALGPTPPSISSAAPPPNGPQNAANSITCPLPSHAKTRNSRPILSLLRMTENAYTDKDDRGSEQGPRIWRTARISKPSPRYYGMTHSRMRYLNHPISSSTRHMRKRVPYAPAPVTGNTILQHSPLTLLRNVPSAEDVRSVKRSNADDDASDNEDIHPKKHKSLRDKPNRRSLGTIGNSQHALSTLTPSMQHRSPLDPNIDNTVSQQPSQTFVRSSPHVGPSRLNRRSNAGEDAICIQQIHLQRRKREPNRQHHSMAKVEQGVVGRLLLSSSTPVTTQHSRESVHLNDVGTIPRRSSSHTPSRNLISAQDRRLIRRFRADEEASDMQRLRRRVALIGTDGMSTPAESSAACRTIMALTPPAPEPSARSTPLNIDSAGLPVFPSQISFIPARRPASLKRRYSIHNDKGEIRPYLLKECKVSTNIPNQGITPIGTSAVHRALSFSTSPSSGVVLRARAPIRSTLSETTSSSDEIQANHPETNNIAGPMPNVSASRNVSENPKIAPASQAGVVDNNVPCEICNVCFCNREAVQRHKKLQHPASLRQNRQVSCPECNAVLKNRQNLRRHSRVHGKGANRECPQCNVKFRTERSRTTHMQEFHGYQTVSRGPPKVSYTCPHCPYGSNQRTNVERHFNSVHLKIRKHRCPIKGCGFRASTKANMEAHKASHRNYGPQGGTDEEDDWGKDELDVPDEEDGRNEGRENGDTTEEEEGNGGAVPQTAIPVQ